VRRADANGSPLRAISRSTSSGRFDAIQEHTYEALADTRFLILHLRKDKRY
jgi:hypothetical protein